MSNQVRLERILLDLKELRNDTRWIDEREMLDMATQVLQDMHMRED